VQNSRKQELTAASVSTLESKAKTHIYVLTIWTLTKTLLASVAKSGRRDDLYAMLMKSSDSGSMLLQQLTPAINVGEETE